MPWILHDVSAIAPARKVLAERLPRSHRGTGVTTSFPSWRSRAILDAGGEKTKRQKQTPSSSLGAFATTRTTLAFETDLAEFSCRA